MPTSIILDRGACVLEAPPTLPVLEPGDILAAGEGSCPDELAPRVCLTSRGAVRIRRALVELDAYAREMFALCGKVPENDG
jgi:hypothetical protein